MSENWLVFVSMPFSARQIRIFSWVSSITLAIGLWLLRPGGLYFLNDDLLHIPLSAGGQLIQRNSWRPVCDLSVMLDYWLWGKNAWGYHFTNLLLHCANTAMVWVFARQFSRLYFPEIADKLFASIAAILFFIYAFHSETIFWIIGRSASLGLLFALPACIFYLRRHTSQKYFWLSLLFFQLGLLTYESSWVFPFFAGVFSVIRLRQMKIGWQKEAKMNAGIWLIFAANLLLRYFATGEIFGKYEAGNLQGNGFGRLPGNFIKLLLRTFLPPVQSGAALLVAGLVLLIVALAIFFWVKKRQVADVGAGLLVLLLLISLLPYVSLGVDTHGVESERYLYLPSVFAVLLFAWLLLRVFQQYQVLLFTLLAAFHLFFLGLSRGYFQYAGAIVETTYQQLNAMPHKKRLFIDSLPTEVRGALIFRLGFQEGWQWLKQPGTVDSVYVLSHKKADSQEEIPFNSSGPSINYRKGIQPYGSTFPVGLPPYHAASDAYMRFLNATWYIQK